MTLLPPKIPIKNPDTPSSSSSISLELSDIFTGEPHEFLLFLYSLNITPTFIKGNSHISFFYFNEETTESQETNLLWLILTPTSLPNLIHRVKTYTNYVKKLSRNDIHFLTYSLRDFLHLLFSMYQKDLIDLKNGFITLGFKGEKIIMQMTYPPS